MTLKNIFLSLLLWKLNDHHHADGLGTFPLLKEVLTIRLRNNFSCSILILLTLTIMYILLKGVLALSYWFCKKAQFFPFPLLHVLVHLLVGMFLSSFFYSWTRPYPWLSNLCFCKKHIFNLLLLNVFSGEEEGEVSCSEICYAGPHRISETALVWNSHTGPSQGPQRKTYNQDRLGKQVLYWEISCRKHAT